MFCMFCYMMQGFFFDNGNRIKFLRFTKGKGYYNWNGLFDKAKVCKIIGNTESKQIENICP